MSCHICEGELGYLDILGVEWCSHCWEKANDDYADYLEYEGEKREW